MEKYTAHILGDRIQSCNEHNINTAKYAADKLKSVGLETTAYTAGIIHDVGKYSAEFNNYINAAAKGENVQKGSVIHTFAGLRLMLCEFHSKFGGETVNEWSNLTAEMTATAAASHHSLFDIYNTEYESGFTYRLNKQKEYDEKAIDNFHRYCCSTDELKSCFEKATKEIEKKVHDIYSLSTNQTEMMFYLGVLQRLITSAVVDGDRTDTAEFMENEKRYSFSDNQRKNIFSNSLKCLHIKLEEFPLLTPIHEARHEMSDYCYEFSVQEPGIYRLNMPTGAGKTLSGLRYALSHSLKYNKKRIIFTVPLLSIIDQNAEIIREIVQNDNAFLEHHSNVIDGNDDESSGERDCLIENWDAPVIVTTLVQFLNTLFSSRMSSVRRFNSLCDSVIVIDEVQTVPEKVLSPFILMLNFLSKICGATIVLCSATQPTFENNYYRLVMSSKEIIPPNKLKRYNEIFRRTKVEPIGELSYEELVKYVLCQLEKWNSVLIVCNTKREAIELNNILKCQHDNVIHLSTSMCMAHRKEKLRKLTKMLNSNEKVICISTQLIEAGVDISFGSVIRIAAGISNIVQAAGRCNRNGEISSLAPVSIVFLKGESLKKLPEIKEAQDLTSELISQFNNNPEAFNHDLISDKAIKYYYDSYFKKLNNDIDRTNFLMAETSMLDLLSNNIYCLPSGDSRNSILCQAYKLAGDNFNVFDGNQKTIIIPYNNEARKLIVELLSEETRYNVNKERKLLAALRPYCIQVFDYVLKQLESLKLVNSACDNKYIILDDGIYNQDTGLDINSCNNNCGSFLVV